MTSNFKPIHYLFGSNRSPRSHNLCASVCPFSSNLFIFINLHLSNSDLQANFMCNVRDQSEQSESNQRAIREQSESNKRAIREQSNSYKSTKIKVNTVGASKYCVLLFHVFYFIQILDLSFEIFVSSVQKFY